MTGPISFDDAPADTCIGGRYANLGVSFQRDDGECVLSLDWAAFGHATGSPPMVLATISDATQVPTHTSAINVVFERDTCRFSALVGNDQATDIEWSISARDAFGNVVASPSFSTNGNWDLDETVVVQSTTPFRSVHIENTNYTFLAVALDDVSFEACPSVVEVPALSGWSLLVFAALLTAVGLRLLSRHTA